MVNEQVTTIELTAGTPSTVEFSGAYPYYWVDNRSAGDVYASLGTPEAGTDGTYTIEVGFEGGSGKSHVLTPCTLKVENGAATATIVWSSEKYDYMLVDGQRYDVLTTEGGSTFEIPVRALDTPLTVIGDTTAMSTPHEIEYTLTFKSATAVEAAQ